MSYHIQWISKIRQSAVTLKAASVLYSLCKQMKLCLKPYLTNSLMSLFTGRCKGMRFRVHGFIILQHRVAQQNASLSPFMLHKTKTVYGWINKSEKWNIIVGGGWVADSHSLKKEAALNGYFCTACQKAAEWTGCGWEGYIGLWQQSCGLVSCQCWWRYINACIFSCAFSLWSLSKVQVSIATLWMTSLTGSRAFPWCQLIWVSSAWYARASWPFSCCLQTPVQVRSSWVPKLSFSFSV